MAVKEKRTLTRKAHALHIIQEQYTPILRTLQEGSQCHEILEHLMTRGSITPMEAVKDYNCYRLSARIADLREKGVEIETEKIPLKHSYYAKYWLKGAHNGEEENDI